LQGPQGLNQFDLRVMFNVVPMAWDHPVLVNYHEAAAFSKWKSLASGKSLRVLTELEHRAIRGPVALDPSTGFPSDPILSHSIAPLSEQVNPFFAFFFTSVM
jgi:hypothetical protein